MDIRRPALNIMRVKYKGIQSIVVRAIIVCLFLSLSLTLLHLGLPSMADNYEDYVPNAPPSYLSPKLRRLSQENAETTEGNFCTVYDVSKNLNAPDFSCTALNGITKIAQICIHPPWLDRHISKRVFEHATFESHLTAPFQYILAAEPEMGVVDIGANIGVYSLYAAMLGRKVVAVEPLYDNIARLHKAIKINGFEDMITLVMNALSNKRAVVKLTRHLQERNYGHTFIKGNNDSDAQITLQEVDAVYMDDLLEVIKFQKALLKIDIEGQEVNAFLHASKLFDAVDIHYVFMEWKWIKELSGVDFLKNFLYGRGFQPYNQPIGGRVLVGNSIDWPFNVIWIRNATKLPKEIVEAYSNSVDWF